MSERTLLGRIERLQIQRRALKASGRYDPAPLLQVERAAVGPHGVLGFHEDGWVADVHGACHPQGRGGGGRAVSVGFTEHYRLMAARFGAVPMGIAGENLIVASDRRVTLDDVAAGLVIEAADGDLVLHRVRVAAPCVEFTSFLLGRGSVVAPREEIAAHMAALDGGMRGFVAAVDHLATALTVSKGDRVYSIADSI